jgi:hypothetical protein
MTTLIFRKGSTEQISSFDREEGELFVDTTKKTVVIDNNAIGLEDVAANNLLPPKENADGKYLQLNGTTAVWSELNIIRPGSVLQSAEDLLESEYIKFDGIPKNKSNYPKLNIPSEEEYGLLDLLVSSPSNFLNANSHPSDIYINSRLVSDYVIHYPMPSSNYNNMVFDGTHYVRILGHYDPNYSSKGFGLVKSDAFGTDVLFKPQEVGDGNVFYPIQQPPYPPTGNQFKVQYSSDGINWNTVTVAPFSNGATRCASVATDGVGGIYMVAQKLSDIRQIETNGDFGTSFAVATNDIVVKSTDHGVTWTTILPISFNDGRIISCNPVNKHLYVLPGMPINAYSGEYGEAIAANSPLIKSTDYGVTWNDALNLGGSIMDLSNNPARFNNPIYTQDGLMVCLFVRSLPANVNLSQNITSVGWEQVEYGLLTEVFSDPYNNPTETRFVYTPYDFTDIMTKQLVSQKNLVTFKDGYDNTLKGDFKKYHFEPCITYNPADNYFYTAQTFVVSGFDGIEIEDAGDGYSTMTPGVPIEVALTITEPSFTTKSLQNRVQASGFVTITDEDAGISSVTITNPGYGYIYPPVVYLPTKPSGENARIAKLNVEFDRSKQRGIVVIKRHIATNALNGLQYSVPTELPETGSVFINEPGTPWEDYAVFDNQELFDPSKDELGLDGSDYRFGLGIHKLHISPIFGFMIFTKNKILYNNDPANNSNGWKQIIGLDETKMYNFSTCINVNDGVIVSAENEVIKLYKSTTKFALKYIPPEDASGIVVNTYLKV